MIKKIYALSQAIPGLKERFGAKILTLKGERTEHTVKIDSMVLLEVAGMLKEAGFNHLSFVTAVDNRDNFTLVYALFSTFGKDSLFVELDLARINPEVESVTSIWKSANWHEREVFDLFGINFKNHPDLRRILMPEDWEGHPLRKDFEHENMVRRPDFY